MSGDFDASATFWWCFQVALVDQRWFFSGINNRNNSETQQTQRIAARRTNRRCFPFTATELFDFLSFAIHIPRDANVVSFITSLGRIH
jgi:hypothetical protein